jgi:hypothetical protein
MADDPVSRIEKILTALNGTLRRRLATLGIGGPDHIIMTIAPDSAGVIRSNCDAEGLRDMAAMLIEIANQLQGEPNLN